MSSCNTNSEKSETNQQPKIKQTESVESEFVKITYNQIVNGYDVNVTWKPKTIFYDNAIGPAILEFKNRVSELTITNNYFALPTKSVDLKISDNKVVGINKNNVSLDYNEPNIGEEDFSSIDVPFVFIDLDFDEIKELIVAKANQGQRWGDAYDTYRFEYGELYKISHREPYSEIDWLTKLDKENKELILYGSGGACSYTFETYSLINGILTLTKIVRVEEDDAGKCYELTYNIVDGNEKLVSKEEVKQ
jgi:hypothetical protein